MSDQQTIEVWITIYACSSGIRHAVMKLIHGAPVRENGWGLRSYEYCTTELEARKVAEEMRQKKIASLRRQLEKLEKTDFRTAKIKELRE